MQELFGPILILAMTCVRARIALPSQLEKKMERNQSLQLRRISTWSMKAEKEKVEVEESLGLYLRAPLRNVVAYA
jgi:hypothetical protein